MNATMVVLVMGPRSISHHCAWLWLAHILANLFAWEASSFRHPHIQVLTRVQLDSAGAALAPPIGGLSALPLLPVSLLLANSQILLLIGLPEKRVWRLAYLDCFARADCNLADE